jgi:predicted MFS family arabinose efflux permease
MALNAGHAQRSTVVNLKSSAIQNQWLVLSLIWIIFVVHGVDRSVLLILLEPIRKDFNLSDTQVGLLSGLGYAIPFALAGIPFGALADRVKKRTYLLATLVALWSGLTAVCGLAPSFLLLLLARAGVGATEAGAPPTMLSLLGDTFDAKTRPGALSIYYTAPFTGMIAGSILAGSIGGAYGWRTALFAVGVPGLILALVVAWVMREPERGRYDNPTTAPAIAPPLMHALRFAIADKQLRRLIIALVLGAFVMLSISSWTPILLQRVYGFSQQKTGFLTALTLGVTGGVGSLLGGFIATRFGKGDPRWLLRFCGFAILLSTPLAFVAPQLSSAPLALVLFGLWAIIGSAYLGPGWGIFLAATPPAMRGTLVGIALICTNLVGAGFGPQVVGLLSDLFSRWHDAAYLQHALAAVALVNLITASLFLTRFDLRSAVITSALVKPH